MKAIQYMHDLGYSHRDIKLENLLFDDHFNLKLADYGFSSNETISHHKVGTYSYMAPEILNNLDYDGKKSDIFSIGVVLFILVVGHGPFQIASPKDKMYQLIISRKFDKFWKIHNKKYKSLSKHNSKYFKDLFIRMVDPDPETRITLKEANDHEWFTQPSIDEKNLLIAMRLRYKVVYKYL